MLETPTAPEEFRQAQGEEAEGSKGMRVTAKGPNVKAMTKLVQNV